MTKSLGFSVLRVTIASLSVLALLAGVAVYGTSHRVCSGPVAGGETAFSGPVAGGETAFSGPVAGGETAFSGPVAGGETAFSGPVAGGETA